jgi:acetyl esterase/lipase
MAGTSRRRALAFIAAAPSMEMAFGPDPIQRLDIYPQPGLSGAPMLLYVHGGAWTLFDKSGVDALPDYAKRHGFLFASTNFRLGSAEKAAEDVAAAVDWILTHGSEYGGDPKRLYIMGHSSGGNTVALVAIDPRFLRTHNRTAGDIAGVIGLDGAGYNAATQIHDVLFFMFEPPKMAMWVNAFGTRIAALSPTRLVTNDGHYPPFLLFYTDHPGGRKYNIELQAKLQAAGDQVTVVDAPGQSHIGINSDFGKAGDPVGERAAAFIATGKL